MPALETDLAAFAAHLAARREKILGAWRAAVASDPTLHTAAALPRSQVNDHIPALLADFERALLEGLDAGSLDARQQHADDSAAHGLHRWQQGFNLREVTRELSRLNECIVVEIDTYAAEHPTIGSDSMALARRLWARQYGLAVSASSSQYFELQQIESRSHISDLEQAIESLRELESQRAQLWQQAAHDLRGNLGVVATASAGLSHANASEIARSKFLSLLGRNVTALHHLLNDVTSLARLQSGQEQAIIGSFDVAALLRDFGDAVGPQAEARGLILELAGPQTYLVDGDAVKVRRIVQNLVLNAIRYTKQGGITVSWGDCADGDPKRWMLRVIDTGPGFHAGPGSQLVAALSEATGQSHQMQEEVSQGVVAHGSSGPTAAMAVADPRPVHQVAGEGIGLSIVKRLCELLDATIEIETTIGVGTIFRVLLPRAYRAPPSDSRKT